MHRQSNFMYNKEEGLKDREEYLQDLRFLLRHEDQLLQEGWYTREDLDELINEDCNSNHHRN